MRRSWRRMRETRGTGTAASGRGGRVQVRKATAGYRQARAICSASRPTLVVFQYHYDSCAWPSPGGQSFGRRHPASHRLPGSISHRQVDHLRIRRCCGSRHRAAETRRCHREIQNRSRSTRVRGYRSCPAVHLSCLTEKQRRVEGRVRHQLLHEVRASASIAARRVTGEGNSQAGQS